MYFNKVHYIREGEKKEIRAKMELETFLQNGLYKMQINLVYSKKKHYLCTMKQEIEKYLESETELNKQSIHIRKIGVKICISLICVGIAMLIFGIIMIIKSI